jgi:alkanesulfonate monooxygenase SsuD/methylene tetrahydromethanopterin reductase-like flavin-dependent oxidoreductase (luciferase family)
LGSPETIAERLAEYAVIGVRTAIVEMPAPYDVETIERLAREVRPMVERGAS